MIDAHHHLWDLSSRTYDWLLAPAMAPIRRTFGVDDLRRELAAAGVRRSVLVEGGREDTGEAAILLGQAEHTEEIGAVVAWADPADPGLAQVLDGYRALPGGHKLRGLRSQVRAAPPGYLDDPAVRRGLALIGRLDLSFDLVVRVDQLPSAARAARDLPSVRFVLDHLGKPRVRAGDEGFAEWRLAIGPLAGLPNAYAKISGLVTEADLTSWTSADLRPYILEALELFGADRLMLGSDWPVCLLAGGYQEVREAMLTGLNAASPAEREAVGSATAARFYRIAS
ncbi:amidohydrolase family protein [Actinoplanes sp. NPDC049265]|uniref:amidohydrolase family protein n=1 Tax=Actinoplanes sp. NPDC049265 TaxID=3363902 RepID=UPI0037144729